LASLAFLLSGSGALIAQDNIVALGRISGGGALVSGTGSPGTVITPVRNSAGDYTVTITSAGAYTGADANDFAVHVTIASPLSGDDTIKADISAVTANSITLEMNTDDVENLPSGHAASDNGFYFTVFRIQSTAVAENTTPYLLSAGTVSAAGSVGSSIGRHGVVASSTLSNAGEYQITLSKPGGFAGDNTNDYVLLLTLEGSEAAGYATCGDVTDVSADGSMVMTVRTDDVQSVLAAASAVPSSRAFHFSVFKTTAMPVGTTDASALVANARIDAAGNLLSGPNSLDGGTMTSVRQSIGDYRVTITSIGAFANRVSGDYVAHATLNQAGSDDDGIMTEVIWADANTLHIDVAVTDVEVIAQPEGAASDAGFYLTIMNLVTDYQPDLRIGRRSSITRMKGDNLYNSTGRGQEHKMAIKGREWSIYHFALENDGDESDAMSVNEYRGQNMRTRYFRLTGGRRNVTASMIREGHLESSLDSGEVILYQGWAKYGAREVRSSQSLQIHVRSLSDSAMTDAVRLNVRRHPSRSDDQGKN